MSTGFDPSKLAKLQANNAKLAGAPRRKPARKPAAAQGDDRKLQTALKKLNVQPIQGVEEVNMFKEDGNVLHFGGAKVHAALPSNTLAIYGNGQDKDLTELVPGILNQLGPDSLASLRKLAESYQTLTARQKAAAGEGEGKDGEGEGEGEDGDDVPDLVESFDVEEAGEKKEGEGEAKVEELS